MDSLNPNCAVKTWKDELDNLRQAIEIQREVHAFEIQTKNQNLSVTANCSAILVDNVRKICQVDNILIDDDSVKRSKKDCRHVCQLDSGPSSSETESNVLIPTAEERATSNQLIVKEILTNLPTSDLLNCRLINKLWGKLSESMLVRKDLVMVKLQYSSSTKEYESRNGSLQELMKWLQTNYNNKDNNKFPLVFVNFKFSFGYLKSADIQAFIPMHGKFIKTLHLALKSAEGNLKNYETFATLRNFLLAVQPSLEYLIVDSLPKDFYKCEDINLQLFPEPRGSIQFPKLKKIRLSNDLQFSNGFLLDLLVAATNLEEIRGDFNLKWLHVIVDAGKAFAVKHLVLEEKFVMRYFQSFCKFAKTKAVKLQAIRFYLDSYLSRQDRWSGLEEAINCILDSSQDTLNCVQWLDDLAFLPGLKLPPVMKMVKRLTFYQLKVPVMPPNCQTLAQIFPNIVTFQMDDNGDDEEEGQPPLSFTEMTTWANQLGSFPSVKNLNVYHKYPLMLLEKVTLAFPNLVNLHFTRIINLPDTIRLIWTSCRRIEHVQLSFEVWQEFDEDFCADMDSSITGMDKETCGQLVQNSRNVTMDQANEMRVGPSILDAKCLKSFLLCIRDGSTIGLFPIMSQVAGIYGLQPLREDQGVQVTIEISSGVDSKSLALIRSYVDYVDIV